MALSLSFLWVEIAYVVLNMYQDFKSFIKLSCIVLTNRFFLVPNSHKSPLLLQISLFYGLDLSHMWRKYLGNTAQSSIGERLWYLQEGYLWWQILFYSSRTLGDEPCVYEVQQRVTIPRREVVCYWLWHDIFIVQYTCEVQVRFECMRLERMRT
jgi:hypothetical protein